MTATNICSNFEVSGVVPPLNFWIGGRATRLHAR